MSLHNATSQQAQHSFFCPVVSPGLSSVEVLVQKEKVEGHACMSHSFKKWLAVGPHLTEV